MLLLEQNTRKERVVDKVKFLLKLEGIYRKKNSQYEFEAIYDSIVYNKELKKDHLPGFYYLVLQKD